MALTVTQKKWAVHGAIGGGALLAGYLLFHGRRAYAGGRALPGGGEHRHGRHRGAEGGERENERGEYGKKKHRHRHGDHEHG